MGSIFSRNRNGRNKKSKKQAPGITEAQSTSDMNHNDTANGMNINEINNTQNRPNINNSINDPLNSNNNNNNNNMNDLPANEERKLNKDIDEKLKIDEQKENRTIGLLLLGAGGSGKSTVLKQMEKIYKGHIAQNALNDAVHYIRQNILEDIYDLSKTNIVLREKIDECKLTTDTSEEVVQRFAELRKKSN